MEIQQALDNIKCVPIELPEAEIFCIRTHQKEAIPTLLEYIKIVADLGKDVPEDYEAHILAMYLLAEFRVHEAFPYLIRFLEFDADFVDWLLDDSLCEDFGQILTFVAQAGDIPHIQKIAENEDIDPYQRLAAATALEILYLEEVYSRKDYFAYLGKLLKSSDPIFLSHIAYQCTEVGARELLPIIENLYENDQIDSSIIQYEEVFEDFDKNDEDAKREKLKTDRYHTLINDTIDRIQDWCCYREEPYEEPPCETTTYVRSAPKVGRNDPCPCGSGKKHKKCCGG